MSYKYYMADDPCEDIEHASDHLEGVLEVLYDGKRSLEDLEFCIEEMCAALNVTFPKTKKLKIQKKENPYFEVGKSLMESSVTKP